MLDPVEKKPLQPDWKPGKPHTPGTWQVLLLSPLFGTRLHSALMKPYQAKGKDVTMIGGVMSQNAPKIIAYREVPSVFADL